MSTPDLTICTDPARRHDFVILFDVTNGNPNGDPDAGNLPRTDPDTGHGLVTDVCLKRKIRNYVSLSRVDKAGLPLPGYEIYVQEKAVLSTRRGEKFAKGTKPEDARKRMCEAFYDVRMFGAVMSMTENNAGQVRGPVQLTFAQSEEPVTPIDVSITRVAVEAARDEAKERAMGRKAILPYALYRASGFFSPAFARQSGVSADDLTALWEALQGMWDIDRSAARGLMSCRGLYVFSHDSTLGNAPTYKLFERIKVTPSEKRAQSGEMARKFSDYAVRVDDTVLPSGITLTSLIAD